MISTEKANNWILEKSQPTSINYWLQPLALGMTCEKDLWKEANVRCSLRTVIRKDLHPVYRVWGFILILDGSWNKSCIRLHWLIGVENLIHPNPSEISEAQIMKVSGSLCSVRICGRRVLIVSEVMQRQLSRLNRSKTPSHWLDIQLLGWGRWCWIWNNFVNFKNHTHTINSY